ncbi:MAG: alpha/beta hydrolase [Capsulimonas sp.]|uniref:alpha/beta fold hydrolase n=1 Tax=Capsulimonas sp. TaxID=2494211 RepID=UPI003265C969
MGYWKLLGSKQIVGVLLTAALAFAGLGPASGQGAAAGARYDTSDAALVKTLPGFENGYAKVNGIQMHYVAGGKGAPLVLLPGWPETWWEYHKVMPALSRRFRVIVVDIRGMGATDKPAGGYDKKTMAEDVYQLVRHLGYKKVNIAGHDIGSMVAFSFAANHPEATRKLAVMDVPHANELFGKISILPEYGKFGKKIDAQHPLFPWWFAIAQVPDLPEKMLDGRYGMVQNWAFDYLTKDSHSIDARDRAVFVAAYAKRGGIHAGSAWFQNFPKDIIDNKKYVNLKMPVLGLGSVGYEWLKLSLPAQVKHFRILKIENSGHYFLDEQPVVTTNLLSEFFRAPDGAFH